jgi:hypothetical protein
VDVRWGLRLQSSFIASRGTQYQKKDSYIPYPFSDPHGGQPASSALWFDAVMLRRGRDRELYRPSGWRSWRSFCAFFSPEEPERIDILIRALEVLESRGEKRDFGEQEARALAGHGGDRRSERARKDQGCNRNLERRGTVEHWMARLGRDDPELAARVERGELTANAAAVAKGWRQPRTPYGDMESGWNRASDAERERFMEFIDRWLHGRDDRLPAWCEEILAGTGRPPAGASRMRTPPLRRGRTSLLPPDDRRHRATVLPTDVQVDLLAVPLGSELGQVPLPGIDPQTAAVDVFVVGDLVAVAIADVVAAAVVGDLQQLIGHGVETELSADRVSGIKSLIVVESPNPDGSIVGHSCIPTNTFQRLAFG